jgi:antitoxin (DNA-binding transcriptional repressor) of toxin-antitoxin stability system
MTRSQTYVVTAARGTGGQWVFQCADFPRAVSRGRSLAAAYDLMPAEIAAAAGVNPACVEVELVPDCTVVPLDDAQASLPELVAETAGHEIYLTRDFEAVAVLIASETYERMLDHVRELEESLARARNGHREERRTFTPAVYEN